jgi:hypothetical protein
MITPEQLNAWRIVPRLLIGWYAALVWVVSDWFMTLGDPSTQQASFVSTVVGLSAAIFGLYVNSGNVKTTETGTISRKGE